MRNARLTATILVDALCFLKYLRGMTLTPDAVLFLFIKFAASLKISDAKSLWKFTSIKLDDRQNIPIYINRL